MRKIILILALILLIFSLVMMLRAGYGGRLFPFEANTEKGAPVSTLFASGFIEAEQVSVASEVGGKVRDIRVEEGDRVVAGDTLAILDDSILEKQINQAERALEVAMANLALVNAGAREEEIRQKKALLQQAEALRNGAKKAWDNAEAMKSDPQELSSKIVAALGQLRIADQNVAAAKKAWDNATKDHESSIRDARARLEAARHQVEQARINQEQAEKLRLTLLPPVTTENWVRPPYGIQTQLQYDLFAYQAQVAQETLNTALANEEAARIRLETLTSAQSPVDAAKNQYDIAVASREMANAVLQDLLAMRQNPQTVKSQADNAQAQYIQALAAVEAAQAALDAAQAGATPEQKSVAAAQVRQSEATLQLLRTQKERMIIVSPITGIVAQKAVRSGEIVLQGVPLLKITNLGTVTLKVFIPETQIGLLKLGSFAEISVDSYPGRVFPGQVTYISPQAEFTPKNIQTKEERAKTVFAVKIKIDNPEGILKPGMPADASIEVY
jgi:multidrug resistance efflux pump